MVRSASAADLPALLALEQHAATAAHWSAEQYRAIFSTSRLALVIEEDSIVLGFLVAQNATSEWELENVVIAESARRRGLATQLVDHLLDLARSRAANAIFLEVRESNFAARRLYEKMGFSEAGLRPNYYRSPAESAVTYRLSL